MPKGPVKFTLIAAVLVLSSLCHAANRPTKSRVDVDSVSLRVQNPQLLVETAVVKVRVGEDAARGLIFQYSAEAETVKVLESAYFTQDGIKHALPRTQIRDLPSSWSLSYSAFSHVRDLSLVPPSDAVALSATIQRTIREVGTHARASLLLTYSAGKAEVAAQASINAAVPVKVYSAGFGGGKQADGAWRFMETGGFGETATLNRLDNPESPRHITVNAYASPAQAALAYQERTAPAVTQTLAMQNLADQIAGQAIEPREITDLIAQWTLANVKRVDVPLDLTSSDPRGAGEVVTDGYGSPDDIVTVIRTLLQAKGIAAVPVLTSSQTTRVSLVAGVRGIFTDVMLFVPALDLYVDPVAPATARAGATLARRANAVALIAGANPAGAYLRRLPGYEPGALIEKTTSTVMVADNGETTVATKVMPAGYAAIDAQTAMYGKKGSAGALPTPLGTKPVPRVMELDRSQAKKGEPYAYGATATYGPALGKAAPQAALFHAVAPIHGIAEAAFGEEVTELCRPGRREETLNVVAGVGVTSSPQDTSLSALDGEVSFTQTVHREDGRIVIRRSLATTAQGNKCHSGREELASFARSLRSTLLVPLTLASKAPAVTPTALTP